MISKNAVVSLASLAALSLSMSGCMLTESQNDIGGHLIVKTAFSAMDKNGKSTVLEAGKNYDTVLHMSAQGSDMAIHPNTFTSIDALLPQPAADKLGKFTVSASASKQAFDVAGEISQESTDHQESGSDSCILRYDTRIVCREVADGNQGKDKDGHVHGSSHHQECYQESYAVYGSQTYEGIRHITNRYASFDILSPGTQDVLASFSGSYNMENYLADKRITSPCF